MTRALAFTVAAGAAARVAPRAWENFRASHEVPAPETEPLAPTPVATPHAAHPRRRAQIAIGIVLALLGGTLLGAAAFLALRPHPASPPAPTGTTIPSPDNPDLAIRLDTTITPEQAAKQQAVPVYNGLRLVIAELSFDVPLGAISTADGQLTPPGIWSAYWVRNLGVSPQKAKDGTVFLVIHTVRGDVAAPGNLLIDGAAGHSTLTPGMPVAMGGQQYRVTRTATISRDELPYRADVWTSHPGTLVLITCLERPGSSVVVDNVVAWARLV